MTKLVNVKVLQVLDIEEVGQEQKKEAWRVCNWFYSKKVVFWEQHVDSLKEGNSYHLQYFYVKEFKGKKHLSIPKNDFKISPISDLQDTVDDIPKDDEYIKLHDAQVIGVTELDTYRACLTVKLVWSHKHLFWGAHVTTVRWSNFLNYAPSR